MNPNFMWGYALGIVGGAVVLSHGSWWDVAFTSALVVGGFVLIPWCWKRRAPR